MTTITDRFRSNFNPGPGDTFGDILWRDHAGDNVLWLMNNNTPSGMPGSIATLPFVPPDWHFKAAANFDLGSAEADILWQHDSGALALWQMNGTTVVTIRALPNPGPTWHVVGDNDFNGDFVDDIFFQNDNGALALWTITSASTPTISGIFAGTQNPGATWHVVGSGDTDADLRAGILWQNDNGALALWENATFGAGSFTFATVAALPSVAASWHVKGMADLNGDQRADIVFQNDSGAVAIWEMGGAAGTTMLAVNLVNFNPGPAEHIEGLRDMNNDGRADLLFQNDNGMAAVWENYQSIGGGTAVFTAMLGVFPNPNPNGHLWDLL